MNTAEPMQLADDLRKTARLIRTTSLPMRDLIPLLQRAADMLERLNDPTGVLAAKGPAPGTCKACGMTPTQRVKYANGCPMNAPELTCPRWASWREE